MSGTAGGSGGNGAGGGQGRGQGRGETGEAPDGGASAGPDEVTLVTWRTPRSAAAELERAALPDAGLRGRLERARSTLDVPHLAYLSTCQRVVWVLEGARGDAAKRVVDLYREAWGREVPPPESLHGEAAVVHLCEVAASLDALVPGEPQVLGQVKAALRRMDAWTLLGPELRHAFAVALRGAKAVRSRTPLFQGQVSLVPLAERHMRRALAGGTVAVAGTGEMGRKVMAALRRAAPDAPLVVAGRSEERVQEAARRAGGRPCRLDDLLASPPDDLDLLVLATAADAPVVDAGWLASRAAVRPLTVVDLGMPRNAAPPDGPVPGLRLVQLDDLAQAGRAARRRREEALGEAHRILEEEVAAAVREWRGRAAAGALERLALRFREVSEERLRDAPGLDVDDPRLRKWYDQTVRALLHEAAVTVKAGARP